MKYGSHVALLVLLVYIATVDRCEGHNRHAQRLRRAQRDWYKYSHPSYDDQSSKSREGLLMAINEKLMEIRITLQLKQQQQPVFIPVYVPFFVPSKSGYNEPHNAKGINRPPSNEANRPTSASFLKDKPTTLDDTRKMAETQNDLKIPDYFNNRINNNIDDLMNTPKNTSKNNFATVACCRFTNIEEQRMCFESYNDIEPYNNIESCTTEAIDRAIMRIVEAYAPSK